MVKVAILDSGYNNFKGINIKKNIQVYYDYCKDEIIVNDNSDDYCGHGTCVTNTIIGLCSNIEVTIIKILNIRNTADARIFKYVLEMLIDSDIELICLCASIDISDIKMIDEFEQLYKQLFDQNKIIVASVQNGIEKSYPACSEYVIGVREDTEERFKIINNAYCNIVCSGESVIMNYDINLCTTFCGNSRSTAIAVAEICKMICDYGVGDTRSILKNGEKDFVFRNKFEDFHTLKIKFDIEKEKEFLAKEEYIIFLYLLCEYFNYNDPNQLRVTDLLDKYGKHIIEDYENLSKFIGERLKIKTDYMPVRYLRWPYTWFEYLNEKI